jgi:hypothetical protein
MEALSFYTRLNSSDLLWSDHNEAHNDVAESQRDVRHSLLQF